MGRRHSRRTTKGTVGVASDGLKEGFRQPVRSVLIERGANGLWRMGSRRGAGTNDLDRELSG